MWGGQIDVIPCQPMLLHPGPNSLIRRPQCSLDWPLLYAYVYNLDARMLSVLGPRSVWHQPSLIYVLLTSPIQAIARSIYAIFSFLRPKPALSNPIEVVCISDTHTKKKTVPYGDLLIHAGDVANSGTTTEIQEQLDWLDSLPHTHKIIIAGNHDTYFDTRSRVQLGPVEAQKKAPNFRSLHYLQHGSIILSFPSLGRQLKIYGASQIPACGESGECISVSKR